MWRIVSGRTAEAAQSLRTGFLVDRDDSRAAAAPSTEVDSHKHEVGDLLNPNHNPNVRMKITDDARFSLRA